jgi:hypothetical protein
MRPGTSANTGVAALLVWLLLAGSSANSTSASGTDTNKKWVNSYYYTIVRQLLPLDKSEGESIAYRFTYPFDVTSLEYSFVIHYKPYDTLPAHHIFLLADVRIADKDSIHEQMLNHHVRHPGKSSAGIKKRIKVRIWNLTEERCPAIRTQFEKFQKIQFKAPPFSTVILDAPDHEFQVESLAGKMTLFISGEDDPAVTWATETRIALAGCGANESAQMKDAD